MSFGKPKPWTPLAPLVPKAQTRSSEPRGPVRSTGHLVRVRQLPCLVCKPGKQTTATDAHHAKSALPAMQGKKIGDYACLPLCRDHHTAGEDRLHRIGAAESTFWKRHGINPADAICTLLGKMYPNPSEDVREALKALQLRRVA